MKDLNAEIVRIFDRLASLLEIEGANPFRVRAYRNAARSIADLPHGVDRLLERGDDLSRLPAVGKDLAGKIEEIAATGRLALLEEVERRTPGALAELTELPGLGAKRVKSLRDQLEVRSWQDLVEAAEKGSIRGLSGFGPKTEAKILEAVRRRRDAPGRMKWASAERVGLALLHYLEGVHGVKQVALAGSYRRRRETVGDIDILVTSSAGSPVMDRFVAHEDVRRVVSKGKTRSTVVLRTGLQVDLRVVARASYGAALTYFTGSKAHNIALRTIAVKKGLKLNEYGVFRGATRVAGKTESSVYRRLGLTYIEPELRENRGEIEASRARRLPKLVTLAELRGDLHVHTRASHGRDTLEAMAAAAGERGYDYLAISDRVRPQSGTDGLDARRLRRQVEQIDRLNERLEGMVVLKSAEVEILEDGRLGLPDSILELLDFTTGAVHSGFALSAAKQTERLIRAMDNLHFNILAHPTGRLIDRREPCRLDMERLMLAALERGCFLELNAQPERLDLNDVHCKMAKELGLKVSIATGALARAELDYLRMGVGQGRRGWLEPDDVLNTRGHRALMKSFDRR